MAPTLACQLLVIVIEVSEQLNIQCIFSLCSQRISSESTSRAARLEECGVWSVSIENYQNRTFEFFPLPTLINEL